MGKTRRTFLVSAAATTAVGAVGGNAAAEPNYEVIEANGQTIRIGDGETWENKLIRLGNRNKLTIIAKGTDWTIRNVGFTGTMADHTYLGVCDSGGGTSRIENVFFSKGDVNRSPSSRPIQIWVDPDHSGHLDVQNVNFGQAGANGIYGSAPGSNGGGARGTIHIDGCYAWNNHHTAYRISDNGDRITNSTVVTTGERTTNRAVWVWDCPDGPSEGGATIENLHLDLDGGTGDIVSHGNPVISTSNIQRGSAPVPDGCPTSAKEAATGGSSDGGSEPPADNPPWEGDEYYVENAQRSNWENLLTLNFDDGQGEFTVHTDAPIYQGYWYEGYQEYTDGLTFTEQDGYYGVTGSESGGRVGLVSNGAVTGIDIDGDGYEVWLNGEKIDPDNYNDHPSSGDDSPDNGDDESPDNGDGENGGDSPDDGDSPDNGGDDDSPDDGGGNDGGNESPDNGDGDSPDDRTGDSPEDGDNPDNGGEDDAPEWLLEFLELLSQF